MFCVDDNADMLEMMRMIIDTEPTMECVGCLNSADRLIRSVCDLNPLPQIILLDATMPGKDPLTVMRKMAEECPSIRTIVYSGHDDGVIVDRAQSAGAWGFVSKREEPDAIVLAIRAVAAGKASWPKLPSSS